MYGLICQIENIHITPLQARTVSTSQRRSHRQKSDKKRKLFNINKLISFMKIQKMTKKVQ